MKASLLLVAAVLLAGCSGDGSGDAGPAVVAATQQDVCELVNAGIAAFNAGDLAGTVERFTEAVPVAEQADRGQASTASGELLEAVRYYADLAPGDYLLASATSPAFARYKAITLGQCAPDPDAPDDGTVSA